MVGETSGFRLQSAAAARHRALVRTEQARARTLMEAQGATVIESADTVINALFIEAGTANAQPWANIAGVTHVYPVRTVIPFMDHAVIVNKVSDAWAQVGQNSAGAGIKIGIIDTGIEAAHAAFQNSSLTTPATFPRVNAASDLAFTNNKIIVARSYVTMLPSRDPDTSARDRIGHGTAVASVAAGMTSAGPLATVTGVAPGAWLGSYKVFGTPGYNDNAGTDAILKALDDAVSDGMDVVNLSLGSPLATRLAEDPLAAGVEAAVNAGVIVVVAAGNVGPDPNTIASPATAPDVISVSAQPNERMFAAAVQQAGASPFRAFPGNGPVPSSNPSGNVADAAALDGTGLACGSLPANSLTGKVALILRGTCTFQVKLTNAQNAGAMAAVIYAAASAPEPIYMDTAGATLPAEMIGNADGVALKQAASLGQAVPVTLSFALNAFTANAAKLTSFGSAGPNLDGTIKPDLIAVGQDMYMAAQTYDANGELYDVSGYTVADGTSFSTPMVTGAAAILKSARPGLTVAQYKSLLVDTGSSTNGYATVQESGGGSLNAGASLQTTAAAAPVSLSFGAGTAFPNLTSTLTVSNIGAAADTFTITPLPTGNGPAPALSAASVQLAPGASASVTVTLAASNLAAGAYEGFIAIAGANAQGETRVPYWYAVASTTPARITVLNSKAAGRISSRQSQAIAFRVTDLSGIPLTSAQPQVTATAGGGSVTSVYSDDGNVPGLYYVDVRLGTSPGVDTFRIQVGSLSADVSITAQ